MKYNNDYRILKMLDNQLYKVLNVKKFMRLKDARATRRLSMPARTKGLLLLDNPSLQNITVEGDIMIRKDCWEIQIYDSKVAENTEAIAKKMKAVAFAKA
jgi:hypothetical protein